MAKPLKLRRRYLTFSLRTLFLLLTALAVWLGVVVNRAREQRDAVEAIRELGGAVVYDWQPASHKPTWRSNKAPKPGGPDWLRRIVGDYFFQEVRRVEFMSRHHIWTDSDIQRSMPHLKRLRGLKEVWYWKDISDNTLSELRAELPNCAVVHRGAFLHF